MKVLSFNGYDSEMALFYATRKELSDAMTTSVLKGIKEDVLTGASLGEVSYDVDVTFESKGFYEETSYFALQNADVRKYRIALNSTKEDWEAIPEDKVFKDVLDSFGGESYIVPVDNTPSNRLKGILPQNWEPSDICILFKIENTDLMLSYNTVRKEFLYLNEMGEENITLNIEGVYGILEWDLAYEYYAGLEKIFQLGMVVCSGDVSQLATLPCEFTLNSNYQYVWKVNNEDVVSDVKGSCHSLLIPKGFIDNVFAPFAAENNLQFEVTEPSAENEVCIKSIS